jgi:RNA polymerase sigma-70 factor (ECF subfamily)
MTDAETEAEQLGRELHELMLKGDVTAPARVAEFFLPILSRKLAARSKNVHPNMIDTAVADTLLDYLKRPEKFDPNKLTLGKFLLMSADRDLKNYLASRTKEVERWGFTENVEVKGAAAEHRSEPIDEKLKRILNTVENETDRKLVSLMAEGIRKTQPYAAVLQITHLSQSEQAKVVKRHKDRLLKVLQRARAVIAKPTE